MDKFKTYKFFDSAVMLHISLRGWGWVAC